ncbi:hypothetical protein ACFWUU_14185 [Kribbella sp. NPDC058693]|nr:hypothetical protein [Kribbella jiaozuonensis]
MPRIYLTAIYGDPEQQDAASEAGAPVEEAPQPTEEAELVPA